MTARASSGSAVGQHGLAQLCARLGERAAPFGLAVEHRFAVSGVRLGSGDQQVQVELGGGLSQVIADGQQLFHWSAYAHTGVHGAARGIEVVTELQPKDVDPASAGR